MKSYLAKSRLVPLVLIFGMILLIFCGVLYNTQILNGSDYKLARWPATPPLRRWRPPWHHHRPATARC